MNKNPLESMSNNELIALHNKLLSERQSQVQKPLNEMSDEEVLSLHNQLAQQERANSNQQIIVPESQKKEVAPNDIGARINKNVLNELEKIKRGEALGISPEQARSAFVGGMQGLANIGTGAYNFAAKGINKRLLPLLSEKQQAKEYEPLNIDISKYFGGKPKSKGYEVAGELLSTLAIPSIRASSVLSKISPKVAESFVKRFPKRSSIASGLIDAAATGGTANALLSANTNDSKGIEDFKKGAEIGAAADLISRVPGFGKAALAGGIGGALLAPHIDADPAKAGIASALVSGLGGVAARSPKTAMEFIASRYRNKAAQKGSPLKSPSEVARINEIIENSPISLGEAIGDEGLSKSYQENLSLFPGAGVRKASNRTIHDAQEAAKPLASALLKPGQNRFLNNTNYQSELNDISFALDKAPQQDLFHPVDLEGATNDVIFGLTGGRKLEETTPLLKEAIKENYKKLREEKTKRYSAMNEKGEIAGFDLPFGESENLAQKYLNAESYRTSAGNLPALESKAKGLLEKIAHKPAVSYQINPATMTQEKTLRRTFDNSIRDLRTAKKVATEYKKAGDDENARRFFRIAESREKDLIKYLEKLRDKNLFNEFKENQAFYKERYAPYKDKFIQNFINTTTTSPEIVNKLTSGKFDRILQDLSPEERRLIAARKISAGINPESVNSSKTLSQYLGLPPEVSKKLLEESDKSLFQNLKTNIERQKIVGKFEEAKRGAGNNSYYEPKEILKIYEDLTPAEKASILTEKGIAAFENLKNKIKTQDIILKLQGKARRDEQGNLYLTPENISSAFKKMKDNELISAFTNEGRNELNKINIFSNATTKARQKANPPLTGYQNKELLKLLGASVLGGAFGASEKGRDAAEVIAPLVLLYGPTRARILRNPKLREMYAKGVPQVARNKEATRKSTNALLYYLNKKE